MAWGLRATVAGIMLVAAAPLGAQGNPDNWEGLLRVNSEKIDLVYLAPEADFRPYTKVMLDPTEVAVRKDWLKDQRRGRGLTGLTENDVVEGLEVARTEFAKLFAEAFTEAGYVIVTAPGEDVMRISTGVVDIDVTAPDTLSAGRTRTYAEQAGAATLVVEVKDSVSGAILGRAVERRLAGDNGPWLRTRASNRADFEQLFKRWAQVSANGLVELRALSPVDVNGAPLAR